MNSIGGLFSDLLQTGLPLDFFDRYVSHVTALTIPDLEAAARSIIDPATTIWMVVADGPRWRLTSENSTSEISSR